ncbi:2-oxoglutarate dehydrogenase, E2 component, dihydrolipoamide succinyltransferase [Brachybacterium sp. JB7]|uniref:2-oxoglutarate dehydrogenase, E2 component, dihydrolipoamide succinyltransferase n=1 Tax=Brachybacterium TaxID=43668 RepID=UPI000DF36FE8|nr:MULTISPECIES: 2-oxoglutarate dehydrogenase, E2 component, dihydrolipoamide succinyltransferase [Brachybacterium]RCS66921.1 2-oxoglutarate dehydrogenase, E2 component, dihydrolipoamide succinyltransferase [Brachybacterium sp. JB7]RCS71776.1 2-oxoglutarate dehydrogenase, E2 component, dihydrolipoamide succinyltransferase [Brachybacterium alimentarium]RCS74139.1 2-oxoglutarate dehydrogenase, E2 component, dihydrolipoamide succinyltransferase [Brachybacterium alimentarium]RCS81780.1 2-oxoglutara
MSESVKMPALGESVTEGTVTRWLKAVGDTVEVDEPLLEVSTDKVDTEIPSPVAGTIEKILVEEDEDAEVGADLVVIGDGSGSDDAGSDDSGAEDSSEEEAPAESDSAGESEGEDLASDETTAPSTDAPADSAESPESDESSDEGSEGGSASGEDVTMPALGESVTEGTVTRWLKAVGDTVEVDEPLLEVSTDKVDTEIPSPVAGTVLEIKVDEDEDAEVGSVLAVIGDSSAASAKSEKPSAPAPKAEEAPAKEEPKKDEPKKEAPQETPKAEAPKAEAPSAPEQTSQEPSAPAAAPKAADSVTGAEASGYVTPLVRKMAAEAGIDLSGVYGSGLGGRIRKQDVQQAIDAQKSAASAPAPAQDAPAPSAPAAAPAKVEVSPLRGTEEKMSRIRKVTAKRMMESLHGQAQLTTAVEVDMTRVAKLRGRAKDAFAQREDAKLTFLPFIMQAAVEALKTYPKVNASIDDDLIKYAASENIGMAADTERGLVVPVIKNAGDLNLAGLARQIGDLGARAKGNKLTPDDLQGATFTITNTGSGGALWDTPIVPSPQVGILGCGTIVKRPAVVQSAEGDDVIAIRSMMYLFLSYDHRLVDGGDAARFLTFMKKRLEDGAFEAELGL